MTEEALADSGVEDSGIDMSAAVDTLSEDLGFTAENDSEENLEAVEEVIESEVKDVPEEVKEEIKLNELPQSWKKEMQEKWDGVDPDTQAYFLKREGEMKDGLDKDRDDAVLGRTMRDVMSPYSDVLKQQNIDQSDMVSRLMNAHMRISTADEAGRVDLINQLAESYGIKLNGEASQVDPAMKSMQDRLQGMERHISDSQNATRQAATEKTQSDVAAFADDPKNALFDEVSEQIVMFINAGQDLETAYQSAIWQNPVTRQKEIDRLNSEATEKSLEDAKQEAEKAKKAKSTNVKGRDTTKAPTEATGTMEDTMREALRDINSRS